MSDETPDAGVGRDIRVEIGRFACPCGNQIVDDLPIDEFRTLTMGTPEHPFTQDTITCDDCGREWALVDDGVYWESRGGIDE